MEFEVRGDVAGGPSLRLDHERFAYAGKFVMSNTGKATVEEGDELLAAAAFNRDRTDADTAWIRYVTVRADRRGDGLGARLLAFASDYLLREHDRVRIAVNNPFAYEACYKSGFGFTGERTGLAELVLERPADGASSAYRDGLEAFLDRAELGDVERSFVEERIDRGPPEHGSEG